jgi:hypothetical protein
MTTWHDVTEAAPELSGLVQARFEATGLGLLATLRADGSPRIGGIEPWFADGEMWLGMMWQSQKAFDLRRDPRCAVHAATVDKEVKEGDARVSGRAVEIDDEATKVSRGAALAESTEFDPNDHGPWHLFRIDVTELYHLAPAGDHLVIRWWTPAAGEHRVERK